MFAIEQSIKADWRWPASCGLEASVTSELNSRSWNPTVNQLSSWNLEYKLEWLPAVENVGVMQTVPSADWYNPGIKLWYIVFRLIYIKSCSYLYAERFEGYYQLS
jgi:hypothetical protein